MHTPHHDPPFEQLRELHKNGYVHGDIRGFNVLFSENGGGLIDFDFSGTPDDTYPPGYRRSLTDGDRIGDGKPESEDKKLAFWHDWYALGKLIFSYHDIKPPSEAGSELAQSLSHWTETPSETKISELTKQDLLSSQILPFERKRLPHVCQT